MLLVGRTNIPVLGASLDPPYAKLFFASGEPLGSGWGALGESLSPRWGAHLPSCTAFAERKIFNLTITFRIYWLVQGTGILIVYSATISAFGSSLEGPWLLYS